MQEHLQELLPWSLNWSASVCTCPAAVIAGCRAELKNDGVFQRTVLQVVQTAAVESIRVQTSMSGKGHVPRGCTCMLIIPVAKPVPAEQQTHRCGLMRWPLNVIVLHTLRNVDHHQLQ
jgi:hypothetical protein